MSIETTPDIYCPNIDEFGNYIDILSGYQYPVLCPCTYRKYNNKQSMSIHNKSAGHIKWLCLMNNNRKNHLLENIQLRQTVEDQKKIIAQLSTKMDTQKNQINTLITTFLAQQQQQPPQQQINDNNNIVDDLIIID